MGKSRYLDGQLLKMSLTGNLSLLALKNNNLCHIFDIIDFMIQSSFWGSLI